MMENTYSTTGTFSTDDLTASPKTMLPEIQGLICNYVKYYNISNANEFGIFGVMTDNQGNRDLREAREPNKFTLVKPQPIDLKTIDSKFATRDFSTLKDTDKIYCFCWHDDAIDETFLRTLVSGSFTLSQLLAFLKDDIASENLDENTTMFKPKVGNGGILNVQMIA